jgi:glutathione S-transferase
MLTLYTDKFWISPYVYSCFVVLREKGLSFDSKTISLGDSEQHKPEYRSRTVTGRVPALDHDGFVLAESSAIVEYLEDSFPAPKHARVLPSAAQERGRARQLMSWLRSDVTLPLRQDRPTTTIFYEHATTPLTEAGKAAADRLVEVAHRAIPAGKTSLFEAWSIADADLAFMLHRLLLNGYDVPAEVRAFAEAQWKRPSVAEFVGRKRPAYEPYG